MDAMAGPLLRHTRFVHRCAQQIGDELRLRFPLPVIQVINAADLTDAAKKVVAAAGGK